MRVVSIRVRGRARHVVRSLVRSGDRRAELQSLLDAVQAGGDHRRHRQVRIDVGAGTARLEPGRLRAAGEDAKARRPVVDAPGRLDGRPEAVDQALVAVDRRPEHRREFHQAGDLAGDVALEQRAHPALGLGVVEEIGLAVLAVLQALVDVAAAAGVLRVPLGHEARHDPEARADLLGAGLEQDRAVGLLERFAESDRGLVDARPGLGVQALDRHAEGEHLVHQRVHELAVAVHAQDRVAEHAGRDRLRVDAAFRVPRLRRLEEVEPLELHPAHRGEAHLLGARENALQRLARADRRRRVVGVDELAEEERHVAVPRHAALGRRGRGARARRESRAASR